MSKHESMHLRYAAPSPARGKAGMGVSLVAIVTPPLTRVDGDPRTGANCAQGRERYTIML